MDLEYFLKRFDDKINKLEEMEQKAMTLQSLHVECVLDVLDQIRGNKEKNIIGIREEIQELRSELKGVNGRVKNIEELFDKIDTYKKWTLRIGVSMAAIVTFFVTIGSKLAEWFKAH